MAKVKLTRAQMALASGESLSEFEKRTGGSDPTEGVLSERESTFYESPEVDDDDGEFDESRYMPESDGQDDTELGESFDDQGDDAQPASKKPVKRPAWADDEAVAFASSYGLKEADLSQFDSVDDLRRYGRLTDSKIAEAAPKASDDTKSGKENPPSLLDKLKPLDRQKYVDAKYGDEELSLVDGLNSTIEALREVFPAIQQQREREQQEARSRIEQEFHSALDEFDPKLFGRAVVDGKVGELSDGFVRNRKLVHDTMERLAQGIIEEQKQRGVEVEIPSTKVLAQRAAAIFAGDSASRPVSRSQPRVNTQAVADQSRRRRPTSSSGRRGAAKGTVPANSPADDVKQIVRNPALQQFWKQAQRENGAE